MTDGIELYDPRLDPKNKEIFGEDVTGQGRTPIFAAQMVKISLRVPRECLIAAENLSNEIRREYGVNVQMAVFLRGAMIRGFGEKIPAHIREMGEKLMKVEGE